MYLCKIVKMIFTTYAGFLEVNLIYPHISKLQLGVVVFVPL